MTKIDYAGKITKTPSGGDSITLVIDDKLFVIADKTILESFHVGDTVRITIRTLEEGKENG